MTQAQYYSNLSRKLRSEEAARNKYIEEVAAYRKSRNIELNDLIMLCKVKCEGYCDSYCNQPYYSRHLGTLRKFINFKLSDFHHVSDSNFYDSRNNIISLYGILRIINDDVDSVSISEAMFYVRQVVYRINSVLYPEFPDPNEEV